jgi:hypothetical protein
MFAMNLALTRPLRTVGDAVIIWLSGMVIGSVVFAVPELRQAQPVPGLSSNPFITAGILPAFAVLAWLLPRRRVSASAAPPAEGFCVGVTLAVVNATLDALVVVGAMQNGLGFYAYGGPWIAYAILITAPWLTGLRALSRTHTRGTF